MRRACLLKGLSVRWADCHKAVICDQGQDARGSTGVLWHRPWMREFGYAARRRPSHAAGAAPARAVWFGRTVTCSRQPKLQSSISYLVHQVKVTSRHRSVLPIAGEPAVSAVLSTAIRAHSTPTARFDDVFEIEREKPPEGGGFTALSSRSGRWRFVDSLRECKLFAALYFRPFELRPSAPEGLFPVNIERGGVQAR